ncbi:MAG TPA: DJ-1/PfpI family protein [Chthoniobacterales bacterium]
MQAAILLFPGVEELDALAPYEVLQTARAIGADIDTALVSTTSDTMLTMSKAAVIAPHRAYAEGARPDLLIVPGGGWAARAPQGARAEAENPDTLALLRRAHGGGTILAGVCTGAMIIAAAGLLEGRPAITHHSACDDLRAAGALLTRARVVDDGDIVTCGGVTSGLDLAIWLVERFFGAGVATEVEHYLEFERRGVVWRA